MEHQKIDRKPILIKKENKMNIEEFKRKKQELFEVAQKEGKNLLTQHFETLFSEIPKLSAIQWTQYTPFFNDGDACVFSIGEPYFYFSEDGEEESYPKYFYEAEDSDNIFNSWSLTSDYIEKNYPEKFNFLQSLDLKTNQFDLLKEFSNFSNELEDLYLMAFGDHVCVTINRTEDGKIEFTVEEYNHD